MWLELAPGRLGPPEEQPVQVKEQAHVGRAPAGLKQVVQGVPISGEFLFVTRSQDAALALDDLICPDYVRDDDAFDFRRRGHAGDPGSPREGIQNAGRLVAVKRSGAPAYVDASQLIHH